MNTKDKAIELVGKMCLLDCRDENIIIAKQCALICVYEMIKELTEEISPSVHGFRHNYWKEVEQEINKL